MEITMASSESRNEMIVMVLTDLATLCKKLSEDTGAPGSVRVKAGEFVAEYNSLLPARGQGTAAQHFQGEQLLIKIARFLPSVCG
jgi:hypothetical protein